MNKPDINSSKKNMEQPFTELFSFIKLYDVLPDGHRVPEYRIEELKKLSKHTDHAINISLQGLQDIGNLLNFTGPRRSNTPADLNDLGYLIASLSNLVEALYLLKIHADFALHQHKVDRL